MIVERTSKYRVVVLGLLATIMTAMTASAQVSVNSGGGSSWFGTNPFGYGAMIYPAPHTPYAGKISSPRFANEQRFATLQKKLAAPVDLQFDRVSLKEISQIVTSQHQIPTFVDVSELEDNGIDTDDKSISIRVAGTHLLTALQRAVRETGAAVAVRRDSLLITGEYGLERSTLVRVYEVTDLVQVREPNGLATFDFDTLIDILVSTIEPNSWDDVGGEATVQGFPSGNRGLLVIGQTYDVHSEIEELLNAKRKSLGLPTPVSKLAVSSDLAPVQAQTNRIKRKRIRVSRIVPSLHE